MRPELPVLINARARISDPENWGKGAHLRGRGRPMDTCCVAEAIEEVEAPGGRRLAAYAALLRVIGKPNEGVTFPFPLVDWNDAPERTHAEVLAAFDKAIEAAGGVPSR